MVGRWQRKSIAFIFPLKPEPFYSFQNFHPSVLFFFLSSSPFVHFTEKWPFSAAAAAGVVISILAPLAAPSLFFLLLLLRLKRPKRLNMISIKQSALMNKTTAVIACQLPLTRSPEVRTLSASFAGMFLFSFSPAWALTPDTPAAEQRKKCEVRRRNLYEYQ